MTPEALEDAIAVTVLFNITGRCADAFDYAMLEDRDFERAAKRLLVQGYALGKGKTPAHPDHRALADAVRRRALEGPGETDAALRQAMAERAAGGPPLEALYDDLARQRKLHQRMPATTYEQLEQQAGAANLYRRAEATTPLACGYNPSRALPSRGRMMRGARRLSIHFPDRPGGRMRPSDLAADETVAFVLAHIAQPPLRILDVGCGAGLVARRLQARGYDVVAIDESAELVQQARALGADARVAAWPSFADTPFDVVLFARSLHHIQPLAEAVAHAHRLLVSSGLVLVEDFAWVEIEPVTAEWFYGVVRLLTMCQVIVAKEDSFATELARSGGTFAFWQQSHDHDLHTVTAMWAALQTQFQSLSETSAPDLYRYLCPVVAENEAGYAIVSQVRAMEQRLADLGTITLIGRRFVGRKR